MSNYDNLRAHLERRSADRDARAEDIRWMTETGECLTGAARRIGIKPDSLAEWCKDNNLVDELEMLRSREFGGGFVTERARAGAAARRSA